MEKITYKCRECGSKNVLHDAYAAWDEENQNFSITSVFDATVCEDCDGECKADEVKLENPDA